MEVRFELNELIAQRLAFLRGERNFSTMATEAMWLYHAACEVAQTERDIVLCRKEGSMSVHLHTLSECYFRAQNGDAMRDENCSTKTKALNERIEPSQSRKLGRRYRSLIANAIVGRTAYSSKIEDICGASLEKVRQHIEMQFQPGMSWDNHGKYAYDGFTTWQIDHKRPCASFDLTNETQLRQCFHYTNLQPLWARANIQKGARIV